MFLIEIIGKFILKMYTYLELGLPFNIQFNLVVNWRIVDNDLCFKSFDDWSILADYFIGSLGWQ